MTSPPFLTEGLGWRPDLPDPRDYTPEHERIAELLKGLPRVESMPRAVAWGDFCPGEIDRGGTATSVACACVALVQYFERRVQGRAVRPSVQFVHQTARRLLLARGDGGEEIRTALKAIARFGIPDAAHWPYDPARLGGDPDAFAFAAARRYSGLAFVRLDPPGRSGDDVLRTVRSFLAGGFACVFGFPLCSSPADEGDISFPTVFDRVCGGQAAVAVGYDDVRRIRSHRGALRIVNSCGPGWGDCGLGHLPYLFVRRRLAADFWTLVRPEWLASGEFRQGLRQPPRI